MRSENQVVILGNSIFEKSEKIVEFKPFGRLSQKEETAILICFCLLDFKLYSLLSQCSGHVQSKNGVYLVEVSIFISRRRRAVKPFSKKKQKTVALFYYHGRLVFKKNCSFYCALDISSSNEVAPFQKLTKTEVKNFSAQP